MNLYLQRRGIWIPGLAALILVGVVVWGFTQWHSSTAGDPGGKLMVQLTPTVSALPGYDTGSIPWVSQIPQTLDTPYATKIEPFQDSCDGRAGTQGWSQVVVQAGFDWGHGLASLVSFMDSRLSKFGWSAMKETRPSNPPGQIWFKTLSNGTRASLSITRESSPPDSYWQLDAIAKPVGKAASGC